MARYRRSRGWTDRWRHTRHTHSTGQASHPGASGICRRQSRPDAGREEGATCAAAPTWMPWKSLGRQQQQRRKLVEVPQPDPTDLRLPPLLRLPLRLRRDCPRNALVRAARRTEGEPTESRKEAKGEKKKEEANQRSPTPISTPTPIPTPTLKLFWRHRRREMGRSVRLRCFSEPKCLPCHQNTAQKQKIHGSNRF